MITILFFFVKPDETKLYTTLTWFEDMLIGLRNIPFMMCPISTTRENYQDIVLTVSIMINHSSIQQD